MLKPVTLAALIIVSSLQLKAQKNLVWTVLGMTTYQEDLYTGLVKPDFPDILESNYEFEEVIVTGYIIPIDVEAKEYALSKNPFSSCFFCGNAGPETVIQLKFENDPGRFATDHYLAISGTLYLNRSGNGLFFMLKNANVAEL